MELNIVTISTPGTGSEVLEQALKCFRSIEENYNHRFHIKSIQKPLEEGKFVLTPEEIQDCIEAQAVLSSIKISKRFVSSQPTLSAATLSDILGLYVSIKATLPFQNLSISGPLKDDLSKIYEFILFRATPTKATDVPLKKGLGNYKYNQDHIEKMTHLAFRTAKNRKKRLILINPDHLEDSHFYWQNTVKSIGESYPSVSIEIISIAQAVKLMITNSKDLDILLTDYFLGTILAAESKVLMGTAELLPEAHDGVHCNLFEPLVSIPKALEADKTNPMAVIYAATLLLSRFGLNEEAMAVMMSIQSAINKNLISSHYQLGDNYSCSSIGDYLATAIVENDEVINFNTENIGLGKSTII
jgi:3-isopropylmalate dehydrogenase